MKFDLSIIVVNFQSASVLEEALSFLVSNLKEGTIRGEIILVNNDVREERQVNALGQRLSLHIPTIILHQLENPGFGSANNRGASVARGDVFLFLNPDARYDQGSLSEMIDLLRVQCQNIFGFRLIDTQGEPEHWSVGRFPSLLRLLGNNILPFFVGRLWQEERLRPVDWVSGAAFALHKKLFFLLGGFDEKYFLYFEDVDLAKRAKTIGAQVWLYPHITFFHHGGMSHSSSQAQKMEFFRGQRRYFLKWRPYVEYKVLCLLHRFFGYFKGL